MLIDQEKINEILTHFDPQYHTLLQYQILVLSNTIEENSAKYQYSDDFKKAINIMLNDIVNGKYLGIGLK